MPEQYQPQTDPRIYQDERYSTAPAPVAAPYVPPARVEQTEAAKGSTLLDTGAAALKAANREEASVLASAGAAMSQWFPAHAYAYAKTPEFDWEDGFDLNGFMNHIPFQLNDADRDFMIRSKSNADATHRMGVIADRNQAQQAMGDNGVTSFLTMALDPTYLAIDVASGGAARLFQLGKIGAAVSATGLTAGVGYAESKMKPTSTAEIAAMSLGMGAASGMFYRPARAATAGAPAVEAGLHPIDPEFPSAQLQDTVRRLGENEQRTGAAEVVAEPGLTKSRVPATGEGTTPVQYHGGGTSGEYDPLVNLPHGEQSALAADGRVLTVQSVADIGAHAESVRIGRTVIDADAKAVYLPGEDKVFLIKDNLKPTDDVKGILLHEYGVHMNAERVLGTKTLGEMLNRLEDLAVAGNQRAKRAFESVPKNTPEHLLREEALGYYVEANHAVFGDSIVNRFVASMRQKLRDSGLIGLKLSENDIVQLVRKAAKGGEKAGKTSFDSTFPMVWHGSPVQGFDALKTEFMGTGEGAQAYGWGHYVTSEKGTALDYRNKEAMRRGMGADEGGLYRVKVNATADQFLDLGQRVQSPAVTQALTDLGVHEGVTGKTAYDYLTRTLGSQKAASEALYAKGVMGNKYATGRSRLAGVQSSNYVLFNDAVADVAARYSKGATQTVADAVKTVRSAKAVAQAIEWSWHKTMGNYSSKAKEIADDFMDSPTNMQGNSVASQQRAIKADLTPHQQAYEDALLGAMGKRGAGLFKRMTNVPSSLKVQQGLEKDVYTEMLRRDRASRDGLPLSNVGVAPEITTMADALDGLGKAALAEMKAAGVVGADLVHESAGYITRRWDIAKIEAIEAKLQMHGPLPAGALRQSFVDTISIGIQRANGWDAEVAGDVAGAIYDRTKRKGMFQDSEFNSGLGEDGAAKLRTLLASEGLTGSRLQRVLDVLEGATDEAGKLSTLKSRVDMHMDESMLLPDGTSASIADMLDTNVTAITDRYMDTVSARSAMARKGYAQPSDLTNARTLLAQSIPDLAARAKAVKSFDEMLNVIQGNPVGEEMLSGIRNAQAVTQMVGLAASGLWQMTEYSTIMAQFGATRVMASMLKEMPFLRNLSAHDSSSLREVLVRNTAQDTRLRPFISRMEDNFEVPLSDSVKLSLQQTKQLVPYANAMKFIQHHQARTTANLIVDTLNRAAKGDAKAIASLETYGLESGSMTKVRADIQTHGMDTQLWSNATWQEVRGPMTKMMDEAVLRARVGEMPQFMHTSTTGKFLGTFRSFVLLAHNKVLAKELNNGGYAGLGLLLLYQMPLSILATATNTAVSGKPADNFNDTIKKSLGQAGALGLFSELFGIATGNKQQFGSPGLIAIDRMYKAAGAVASGSPGNSAAALLNVVPVLSSILPMKAVGEALKESKQPQPK